jgi:multicomponent Na+:H+ antiporter subunit D
MSHLPVLQVVLPLLSAPLCVLLRDHRAARVLASIVAFATLGIAGTLLQRVLESGHISYRLGGWEPPWGIEYRIDVANAFVLVVVAAIAAVVLPTGPGPGSHRIAPERQSLYYASFLLCLAGLLGMTATGDAFNVFVFLEISSLATYTLVSLGQSRRALRSAFVYLLLGTVGGTFVLLGIGLMYEATGTLNMADLAVRLPQSSQPRTIVVAFAFLTVGLNVKLAVFPLHQWLVGAYGYAPSAVSAFIAGTATKVIYYLLLRFVFSVFGLAFVFGTLGFGSVLLPLSLAAMFVGSLAALYQKDLKRLLAYSSIAQIGYLTLGLSFGTESGVRAGLVHLFGHALMKSGLFMVCACLVARLGSTAVLDLRGIGRRMPLTSAAFVLGGLGMIGVPGTVGFVSKWYLVLAALEGNGAWVASLILLSSLIAAAYVWKIVELAYLRAPPEGAPRGEAPAYILVPTLVLLGASVYFGVATELPTGVAKRAAAALVHGGS